MQAEAAAATRTWDRARDPGVWLLLDSSRVGGIETHVATLACGLAAAAVPVEVVFLTDHGPHPMRALLDRAGTAHRTLTGGVRGLVRALRRRRPSLVHTHGYKAGVLGRLAGAVLGIPVVSTFHAGEPGTGLLRLYNAIDRATAFLAHPIAVSEPILARLPRRTRMIQNFVALPPRAARPGPRPRTIAFVGRLSHEKGPDEFCALADSFPAARFELFGDGPMRESLAARFAGRVRFRGAVPSMSDHWRDIGLLCMPSRHEGLPLAALEAMANGVPVAAYAVGGLPRCIEHGRSGWLAAPGQRAELVAAIAAWQAQDDDAAGAMAEAARATIARDFSREAGVDKVLAVYAQALGRPG